MHAVIVTFFAVVRNVIRRRADLEFELLALRQQVLVLQRQRGGRRLEFRAGHRLFWMALARLWSRWRDTVVIVKPETVIGWSPAVREAIQMTVEQQPA